MRYDCHFMRHRHGSPEELRVPRESDTCCQRARFLEVLGVVETQGGVYGTVEEGREGVGDWIAEKVGDAV